MKSKKLISLTLVLAMASSLLMSFAGAADETVSPDAGTEGIIISAEEAEAPVSPETAGDEEQTLVQEKKSTEEEQPSAEEEPRPVEEEQEPVEKQQSAEEEQESSETKPEKEEPEPAEQEPEAAGEEPEQAEEEQKPAEEAEDQSGNEEPAQISFSEGYVLIRKDTNVYADETGRELLGVFTGDAEVYAVSFRQSSDPAKDVLKIIFDTISLREKNEPLQTGYLPASKAEPLTEAETEQLKEELDEDPDAREYDGKKIRPVNFAFAEKGKTEEETEEGGVAANGAVAMTLIIAPSGSVRLGVGETVKILAKADNASGDVTYSWETSPDEGRNWTKTGSDTDLQTIGVSDENYQSLYGNQFRCAVTDDNGTTRSAAVTIRPPFTVKAPSSVKAGIGKKVKLTAKPSVTSKAADFLWQYSADNGKTWKNCTYKGSRQKTLTVPVSLRSFFYRFRCLVTIGGHSMYSNTVFLRSPYTIRVSPAKKELAAGKTAKFKVKVKGAKGKITYRWQKSTDGGKTWKNTKIKGYKTKAITVKASESTYGTLYRCVVKAHKGKAVSPVVGIDSPGSSQFIYQELGTNAWKITGYKGKAVSVTIPTRFAGKLVTAVGENAFKGNTAIRTVTVPSVVTSIGANAFDGCTSLVTVTLTNSITFIGAAAFQNCTSLSNVWIGN